MARFPSPYQVSGPESMRPAGPLAVEDVSGLTQGVSNLAAGLRQGAQSIATIEQKDRQRKNVADLAKADATWTRHALELGNSFDQRNDYEKFREDGEAETARIMQEAAANIADPEMRERWLQDTELKRLVVADNFTDLGRVRGQEKDRATLVEAIAGNAELISDPGIYAPLRDKARADIAGSIDMAEATNLITTPQAIELRDKYLDGADEALAENRAMLDITAGDPRRVLNGMGISEASMGGQNLVGSAISAAGGAVTLSPEVALLAGQALGDKALPSDPALAAAYLKDPEMNARYVTAAIDVLTQRYRGDITAAVIAAAPGGGLALAERWIKSNHDESVLPRPVRDYYRKAMTGVQVEADMRRLPIITEPDVDIESLDVGVLDRWEQVQSVFGTQLPVISGYRDPEHNAAVGGAKGSQHVEGRAIDINVKSLSEEEVVRLIETASAMGFTGIGVYENSLHLDAGNRRAWGPTYKRESVPAWAEDAINRHLSGSVTEPPINVRGIDPTYAALPFDKRLKLFADAKAAIDRQALDMRAGIEIAVQNAPSAIMSNGAYTGQMPNAEEFVEAYGAAEGIERFKAFDASVDVAQTSYGMRTMSAEEIAATVEDAVPTSTGDMAAIESKRFETLSKAAETIMDQRDADPAGYVIANMPSVAAAWDAVGEDPTQMQAALTITAEAQEQLGMDMRLLPAQVAKQAADVFNDLERPQAERMASLTGLIFSSSVDEQREAILEQLVSQEGGVPPFVRGAVAAMERGDQGAAAYLFRAAMTDPKDLPSALPRDIKPADVSNAITGLIFEENQIGDVIYGLTDGTAENFARAMEDTTLIERAAKLRLFDGSANSAEEAVKLTMRDMYGDVRVVTGKSWGGGAGVKITLPQDEPEDPMRRGFNALLPAVGDALKADMTNALAGADTANSQAAILATARDQYVATVMEEGYFTNAGDGFVFIDPKTGSAVADQDGEPLTFSRDEVLAADAEAGAAARGNAAGGAATIFDPFGLNR